MLHQRYDRQLILNHNRRLQKLKEIQALQGLETPPSVLLEIEDIQQQIEILQQGLLDSRSESLPDFHKSEQRITQIYSSNQLSEDLLQPFTVGPPITHPRFFFGRERIVKRLFKLWQRLPLQNAAVIGPRRSGKTSLLFYLKNITNTPPDQLRLGQKSDWLSKPEIYKWVYVDFQDPRLGSQEGLIVYLLKSLGISTSFPCDLNCFIDVVSQKLNSPTIIMFDEIGVALQRYTGLDDTFWEGLRALATHLAGGNLGFVLSAHERPDQLAYHSNLGSPFFNIFGYTTQLSHFSETEARELINSTPIPFADTDIEWMLTQSGCCPILLQILCREYLSSLEEGCSDNSWRNEGLVQIEPFRYLMK